MKGFCGPRCRVPVGVPGPGLGRQRSGGFRDDWSRRLDWSWRFATAGTRQKAEWQDDLCGEFDGTRVAHAGKDVLIFAKRLTAESQLKTLDFGDTRKTVFELKIVRSMVMLGV
jgi:hypothetical protein